jgi:tRNA(Ile)-lysidine synthase
MFERFLDHISVLLDTSGEKRYLLAFSGGKDSVCLAHLLIKAQVSFEMAHVNFGLRGEESDGDEVFARNWASDHKIHFHVQSGNTEELANSKGISIQMAAREIRYDFFEKIRRERNLSGILLAHHEDDQIETILLNLLRGTGIEGIYGMADRKGWLIRPLLPFSREEIEDYILHHSLSWREDSSNQKTDYKRNRLRHKAIPALLDLEPDAKQNLLSSFTRLKDTGKAFMGLFEGWKARNILVEKESQFLPYSAIQNQPGGASLLYFWLRPFGFNSDQSNQILRALDHIESGKIFNSPSHKINFDREGIFLSEIKGEFSPIYVDASIRQFNLHEEKYELATCGKEIPLDKNPENAQLDAELLEFPLEIRTWEEGDRFIPLGMDSNKKLSDFLIDSKIPMIQKEQVKVLLSAGKIAWVIGLRIADWAKRTPATRQILYFKKC